MHKNRTLLEILNSLKLIVQNINRSYILWMLKKKFLDKNYSTSTK